MDDRQPLVPVLWYHSVAENDVDVDLVGEEEQVDFVEGGKIRLKGGAGMIGSSTRKEEGEVVQILETGPSSASQERNEKAINNSWV